MPFFFHFQIQITNTAPSLQSFGCSLVDSAYKYLHLHEKSPGRRGGGSMASLRNQDLMVMIVQPIIIIGDT